MVKPGKMGYRKSASDWALDVFVLFTMIFVLVITLYPFIYIISMSISGQEHVLNKSIWLYPKDISLHAYRQVFANPNLWQSYYNTIFYTVVGTLINVVLTVMMAYPLSRPKFVAKKFLMLMIVVTMFFSGGLVPLFILIQNLGLYNTRWALLLPGAVGAFYVIIARTFFQSIPESLHESAKLDGAHDADILTRIVLPLSKPILAVLPIVVIYPFLQKYFVTGVMIGSLKE